MSFFNAPLSLVGEVVQTPTIVDWSGFNWFGVSDSVVAVIPFVMPVVLVMLGIIVTRNFAISSIKKGSKG